MSTFHNPIPIFTVYHACRYGVNVWKSPYLLDWILHFLSLVINIEVLFSTYLCLYSFKKLCSVLLNCFHQIIFSSWHGRVSNSRVQLEVSRCYSRICLERELCKKGKNNNRLKIAAGMWLGFKVLSFISKNFKVFYNETFSSRYAILTHMRRKKRRRNIIKKINSTVEYCLYDQLSAKTRWMLVDLILAPQTFYEPNVAIIPSTF